MADKKGETVKTILKVGNFSSFFSYETIQIGNVEMHPNYWKIIHDWDKGNFFTSR